jgi:MFS family permease
VRFRSAAAAENEPRVRTARSVASLPTSEGELGLAILGLEAGAIVGLPTGGALVARAGSRQALRIGFAIYPAALVAVALAPGLASLAASLALMAASSSVVDVAINAQGVELERRYERPILSGFHAGHPFGLVAGGLAGTAAAVAETSLRAHFAAAAAVGLVTALAATTVLVREPARHGQQAFVRPSGRLLLLGLTAFCAFLLDGAAPSVSGASPGVAIAAVTTIGYLGSFSGPPAIGAVAEISGLSAALGLLVAVSALMLALARPSLPDSGSPR